jgi:hypothetical protein
VIGAKTLAVGALTLAVLVAALALGVLTPERLITRGWGTLFLVGVFGAVVGTLTYRFWRLGEPSAHYFRWLTDGAPWEEGEGHFLGTERARIALGDNRGDAWDLPPRAQHGLCVLVSLLVAVACIDGRALGLMSRFGKTMASATGGYCPEPTKDTAPTVDPNAPGCELVRRAYALGYASTLGDCAPKKKLTPESQMVCTRRQRDEPMAHYAWRLLDQFWTRLRETTGGGYMHKMRADFDERFGRLGELRSAQRQVLASAPHASHHVWTNLPDPKDDSFTAEKCADRFRWMAHRPTPPPGPAQASLVFEHVLAQLLFESRYEPSAGYCRELHVHWGAPKDACQQLVASPEAFLKKSGALESVRAVLDRYRLAHDLVALGGPKQTLAPAAVVSFQCYIEDGGNERKSTPLSYGGYDFTAEELHVAPSPANSTLYIDRYDAVARLMVNGFHYGRLLSEAGLGDEPAAAGMQASFSGHDFLLSRLYGLDSVDIYLDPGWMASRPDLLEVYPYQRHLKNYVLTFRRQYVRARGRL